MIRAIESGGDLEALVARAKELQAKLSALPDLAPIPRLEPRIITTRLGDWRRLLRQSSTQARAVLQRVLTGRIIFQPGVGGYTFEAETRLSRLFAGIAVPRPAYIKPNDSRGLENVGHTLDADYAEVLERAYGKLLASPTGLEPVLLP